MICSETEAIPLGGKEQCLENEVNQTINQCSLAQITTDYPVLSTRLVKLQGQVN